MSQRLVGASHDSESDMFVTAFHKSGNDGMKRTLSAREHIGMIPRKREAPAAIVKNETQALNSDARAEVVGDTLNPTYDVEGLGFILHNRGWGFTLERDHPDVLAGG